MEDVTFYTSTPEGRAQKLLDSVDLADTYNSATETVGAIATLLGEVQTLADAFVLNEYEPGAALITKSESPVPYTPDVEFVYEDEVFLGEVPDIPDLSVSIGTMPEFSYSKPGFGIPDPPNVDWPEFTEDPPSQSALNLPNAPDVILPDPPSLNEVDIPAPPSAAVPEFEGVGPTIDLTPPNLVFSWNEDQYASGLLSALTSKLESDMAAGGQGFSSVIEQAQYDREKSLRADEEEAAYGAILDSGIGRGWMSPPGSVVGNIVKLSDKISQDREGLNGRLLAEQTVLALKNGHHTTGVSVKMEAMLIEHHNNIQQRNYDAAKFALSSALEVYKVRGEAFKVKTEAYAVAAKVYDAKIKAETVKAELYKAHIEGLKVGVEMNSLKVQRYKAQLQGIKALVAMYGAEMRAGHVIAEVERARIQGYLASVEAYKARISAIQARADGYVVQVKGVEIQADMVEADANAYAARMKAYASSAQVEVEKAKGEVRALRARLQIYSAQVDKYSAAIGRDIGLGMATQRLRDTQAKLRVLQSRYEEASSDLEAKLYQAQVIAASAGHRGRAISMEGQASAAAKHGSASVTVAQAGLDAATALHVARMASDTTNISENTRITTGEDKGDKIREGKLTGRRDGVTVSHNTQVKHY